MGGGVGGVQYCPVLMLNNEPHTADNGYYCADCTLNKGEYIPQRFNFSTDLLVPVSAPSQYLEFCFVMEISDEAVESDHLFVKTRTGLFRALRTRQCYPPLIASLLFTGGRSTGLAGLAFCIGKSPSHDQSCTD